MYSGRTALSVVDVEPLQENGEYAAEAQAASRHCLQLPVEILYNQESRVTMKWNSPDAVWRHRIP